MGIAVLGPLDVDGPSAGLGARDRVVLAALAMGPRRTLTAEQLADAVWGDAPPASWRKNLQGCIVRLRRVLGTEAIATTPHGYRLALAPDDVDADVFERLVARGRELLTLGEPERAAYTLEQALTLWRGRPLADLEDWEPGRTEAARLEELRLEAEEDWLDGSLRAGHHRDVLARAQALVQQQPLRERRWQLLARAEYQCGRQGEALRTLQDLRRMLVQELGIDPDPEVVALERAILSQDPVLEVSSAVTESHRSPYPGLRAYDVADAEAFFGRERDIATCLDRLRSTGVLAVVGPSGTGKSSLVRAGVAASLRREGHHVDVITPGARPLDAWPAEVPAHRHPVLVVDQCEEVFALCDHPAARTEFLDRVVARAGSAGAPGVVVALRADRMGDLAGHPAFGRLVERGLYLLGAMGEDDLRAAIEGPARQAGLLVEPGLVDLLLREVEGAPAALPMLSHSLRETWVRREGRTLTVAGYHASGGIREAIARTAETVYEQSSPRRRELLRDLMLRLVAPGVDGAPLLARVPRSLLAADPDQAGIVDALVAARLLTSDEGSVALTHEAIVRTWPRLGRWLDEDLEGRRILHHLAGAADAWDGLGRPASELYRGTRLQRALEWRDRAHPELASTERDFLAAAQRLAETEQRSAEQRAREQARMIHRLRIVLAGAVALLLVALAATAFAVHQGRVADRRAAEANLAETKAVSRDAGSAALVTDDVDESLLLAVAGVRLDDSVDSRRSLLAAIGRHPQLYSSTVLRGDDQVTQLDVSPHGGLVAAMDFRQRLRVYDSGSGELLAERQVGAPDAVLGQRDQLLAFSPEGRTLAVAVSGGPGPPVLLLDARTLERSDIELRTPREPGWFGTDIAWSQDGHHLAAAVRQQSVDIRTGAQVGTAATALVWDLRAGGAAKRVRLPDLDWQSVGLSPDGTRLYTSDPLVEHDLVHGGHRVLDPRPTGSFVIGRDGHRLVALLDGRAFAVDLRTDQVTRLDSTLKAADLRFARDGRTLVLVEWNDRRSEIWRIDDSGQRQVASVDLDRGVTTAVAFGADRSFLYSASGSSALRRWDLTGQRQFVRRDAVAGERGDAAFAMVAPDGAREVFIPWGGDGFAVHDLETGDVSRVMRWGEGYRHTIGAWHPDGRHFATAVGDQLRVWDLRTATRVDTAVLPGRRIAEIDYTPDGSRLVVTELSGRTSMLSTRTWTPVGKPVELGQHATWVQAGPDDRSAVVLTGGFSATSNLIAARPSWALVDLVDGTVTARGAAGVAYGAWLGYSPDGRYAAVAGGSIAGNADSTGADGKLAVIDLRTRALVRPAVTAHQGVAFQLAYSPDGTRILTSGLDGTVALWDATAGTLLGRVTVDGRPYTGVGFSPDGRSARIVDWFSGRTWIWPLDTDSAVAYACRAAGREVTSEEWRDHFGDRPYQHVCAA